MVVQKERTVQTHMNCAGYPPVHISGLLALKVSSSRTPKWTLESYSGMSDQCLMKSVMADHALGFELCSVSAIFNSGLETHAPPPVHTKKRRTCESLSTPHCVLFSLAVL